MAKKLNDEQIKEIENFDLPDFLNVKIESVQNSMIQAYPKANLKLDVPYGAFIIDISTEQKTAFGKGCFLTVEIEGQGKRSIFINESMKMGLARISMIKGLKNKKDFEGLEVILQKLELKNSKGVEYKSATIYLKE